MGQQKQKTKARRPRGTGSVYRPAKSRFLWIKYSKHGKPYRESTGTTDQRKAANLLQSRLAEIATGAFVGPVTERVKVQELAEDFLRDYRINERKSIDDVKARWELHLKPFFGVLRAKDVTSDMIARYIDARQSEGAKNATINRELAAMKRMYRIGYQATPPKVHRVPAFPFLKENNTRTGFLDDAQYHRLVEGAELWFRALVECGKTYGWRIAELLIELRVSQVDLVQRVIRLEPGTTKNNEGREVVMSQAVHALLSLCVAGKGPADAVFTRSNSKPVRSYRDAWQMQCVKAGLGKLVCRNCTEPQSTTAKCAKCGFKGTRYTGLIFHDLRRTAARNLRSAGVSEGVIMKIGGWLTNSVFRRYAIVDRNDIADAMHKLQLREAEARDKSQLGHSEPKTSAESTESRVN